MTLCRCCDPSELGCHYSSLQCPCGGFYSQTLAGGDRRQGGGEHLHLCSSCGAHASLHVALGKVAHLASQLEEGGWKEELEQEMEQIPGVHRSHHLRIQIYMDFLDDQHVEAPPEVVLSRSGEVLHTLALLDKGCSRCMFCGIYPECSTGLH